MSKANEIETLPASVKLVKETPQEFEKILLSALILRPEIWVTHPYISSAVCKSSTGDPQDDFDNVYYNIIFEYIRDTYTEMLNHDKMPELVPPTPDSIRVILRAYAKGDDRTLTDTEVPAVLTEFSNLSLLYRDTIDSLLVNINVEAVKAWLRLRRASIGVMVANSYDDKGKSEIVERTAQELSYIDSLGSDADTQSSPKELLAGLVIVEDEKEMEKALNLIKLPPELSGLQKNMGGGLAKGELLGMSAPTGGGKTNFCCQWAAYTANSGLRTMYISTEMSRFVIFNRMVCSIAQLDISRFRENHLIRPSKEDLKAINMFAENTEGKLTIIDWSRNSGKNLKDDLGVALRQYKQANGVYPDVLFVDWVGGGLKGETTVSSEMTLTLLNTTAFLAGACKEFDMAGVAAYQSGDECAKKKVIYKGNVRYCHNVAETMTMFLGVSAAPKEGIDNAVDNARETVGRAIDTQSEEQTFNLDKTRSGPTALMTVKRDFKHCRFIGSSKRK